jgi:hypothetical protein
MTWFRVPLACLVFAMVLAPFAAKGAAPAACPEVTENDDWVTIQAPGFPEGPAQITAYAVHPHQPSVLLVTNGKTVMATTDGGCTWAPGFTMDLVGTLGLGIVPGAATITSIVFPEHVPTKSDGIRVYLLIEEQVPGAVTRPHVVVSRDGGTTWAAAVSGLAPVTGAVIKMRAAPSDPDVVYLLASSPGAAAGLGGGEMYATTDGGGSWELRGQVGPVSDFAIDPFFPDELWMSGPGGLRHSVDGARSATEVPWAAPPVTFVDVFRADEDAPSRIIAHEAETFSLVRSDDGGKTWTRSFGPGQAAISVAHGNSSNDVVISSHLAFHRFRPPHHWIDVTEADDGSGGDYQDIHDLQVDRTASPSVFGFTPTAIKAYTGFSIELPPLISGKVPEIAEAVLSASERIVRLEPGESRAVDFRLSLPPSPTPLDVYFVLDTTNSMSSAIKGLASGIHGISQELASANVDARFGLAEFKDYPIAGYGDPTEGDVPYRQKRDLGAADAELVAALESLEATGGGRAHIPESQLTALYQSATGEGEPGFVEPGQEASFRGDALKVLINITDAPFENSPAHPSPQFDVVARELGDKGILQVGLAVWGKNGYKGALQWLSNMASETGTVAPAGGVDCDEDGEIDVPEGEPLVCVIADEEEEGVAALAPAILSSLRALIDRADVSLVATTGAGFIDIVPPTYPEVNVKVPNILGFDGTITCPETGSAGGPIEVVATVAGETVAGTALRFVCRPVETEKVVPPKEEEPPVAVVPPAPVPQPGLAPVPPPPAPPAPVTQTQPQPNPHAQAALAQQEQDQVQTALATSFDQTEGEYAFSSYSRRSRAPGAGTILYMSALVMTSAAAAFALRHRPRPAFARSRGPKT